MNLSDPTTRYCRVALYAETGRSGCDRRVAHQRGALTNSERSRQLAALRFDRAVTGQCWNPR